MGVSGGGPHTLACAALLPDRVTRAAVLVGAAPSDDPAFNFLDGMAEVNMEEFGVVPRSHGEYLAAHLPSAEFDVVPNAGHLLLDHWPDALDWLVGRA
jgi:pimeloyl-ACP methyl ester carboxylesterase